MVRPGRFSPYRGLHPSGTGRLIGTGTGYLGIMALRGPRDAGMKPQVLCDNNSRRWGFKASGGEAAHT